MEVHEATPSDLFQHNQVIDSIFAFDHWHNLYCDPSCMLQMDVPYRKFGASHEVILYLSEEFSMRYGQMIVLSEFTNLF